MKSTQEILKLGTMGKKTKGGRRQILQLDDKNQIQSESEHSSSILSKEVCPLDVKVADFLKEINALTVNEDSNTTTKSSSKTETELRKEETDISNESEFKDTQLQRTSQSDVEISKYHPWQEIHDTSTGYSYYWNVETNAVTWDCPYEFETNIEDTQNLIEDKSSKKGLPEEQISDKSIIPISYFEHSSSSDESSNSCSFNKKADFKRKRTKKTKKKASTQKEDGRSDINYGEIIGPQLPPHSEIIGPQLPPHSEIIGPQLPPQPFQDNSASNFNFLKGELNEESADRTLSPIQDTHSVTSNSTVVLSNSLRNEHISSEDVSVEELGSTRGSENASKSSIPNKLIVEYDSFSDEEEEISSAILKKESIEPSSQKLSDEILGTKRKQSAVTNKGSFTDQVTKKQKTYNQVNIDDLFMLSTSKKHGFGYKQSETPGSKDINDYKTNKKKFSKPINFVKSDYILNASDPSENSTYIMSNENSECFTVTLNSEVDSEIKTPTTTSDDEAFLYSETLSDKETNQPNTSVVESHNNENIPKICNENVSLDFEQDFDIDEIDKALCEALEAKKALSSKTSMCAVKNKDQLPIETTELQQKSPCEKNESKEDINEADIQALSTTLIDKLSFLVSNHSLISLSTLLVQVQTRMLDWQASALQSKYFVERLQEVKQYIYQYEIGIVSGDWICQWDRENKRYYYLNSKTQQSQWSYPEDLCSNQNTWTECSTNSAVSTNDPPLPPSVSGYSSPSIKKLKNSPVYNPSPPPPPPGTDSPPPPPPSPSFSEDMDLENSNDSVPGIMLSSSNETLETKPVITAKIPEVPTKTPIETTHFSNALENDASININNETLSSISSTSINSCSVSSTSISSTSVNSSSVSSSSVNHGTSQSKKEKKKPKLKTLALKKKNIPSLVEKWRKIRAEQEKEDK